MVCQNWIMPSLLLMPLGHGNNLTTVRKTVADSARYLEVLSHNSYTRFKIVVTAISDIPRGCYRTKVAQPLRFSSSYSPSVT